jgi:hypothetical protein
MVIPVRHDLSNPAIPEGMVRISAGAEHRFIWPVHLGGWQSLGWQQQEAAAVSSLDVDLDGRKGDEIRQIGGEGSLDVWHSFYSKLRDSKEYSKRHSDKYQVCLSLSLISCHFLDCAGTGRYTLDTRSFIILGWKNEEHVSG